VPEWYLLPFYAMLRSVPQKLIGVLVLAGAISFWPSSRGSTRAVSAPTVSALDAAVFLALCGRLRIAGLSRSQSVDAMWHVGATNLPLVWLARLGTVYYYAFFLVLMPVIGLFETPGSSRQYRKSVLGAAPAE